MAQFPAALQPSQEDIKMMLACDVHRGSRNIDPNMARYIWERRSDGHYIFNLQKTWEKLMLAARAIVAVEKAQDVAVISARQFGQRAVLKFSHFAGIRAISGRFTPGTFTNQIQKKFIEPRLLVVTDPYADGQALIESSYVNLPTIAFVNSEQSVKNVDICIPCNNKGKLSVGLMYWLLCREVLRLRGTISRQAEWEVMVDLFFYRDPDEVEKEEAEALPEAAPAGEWEAGWGDPAQASLNWGDASAPPAAGAAGAGAAVPPPAEGGAAPAPAPGQWDGLANAGSAWQQSAVAPQ